VFDGDQAGPGKGTAPTQFLAHVYCGQTADSDDLVLDGAAAPPKHSFWQSLSIVAKEMNE